MKWKRSFFSLLLFFLAMFVVYNATVHFTAERPVINSMKQKYIIQNTNIGKGITLNVYGQNLDNIIAIYLNNVWEEKCEVEYISTEEIHVTVPQQYCLDTGAVTIQLEKKINSDKTVFSNKATVQIIEDSSSVKPVITGTIPQVLELSNTENKSLHICGHNFKEGCVVSINNKNYDVKYIDESNVEVLFSYADWCKEESLFINISQYATDEDIVYNLASNKWTIDIVGNKDYTLKYDWIQHRLIARAFGIYNEKTYTNSLEAFRENYEKGFRVFEVDITYASDNILMLRHDWWKGNLQDDTNFTENKINNLPKPFDEIKRETEQYTLLSFDDLCKIMIEYPDIYIVTDTKDTNSSAINEIFQYMVEHAKTWDESILDRVIVQIYNEQMYYQVMNIYSFQSIIYTLYQTVSPNEEILDFVEKTGIKVVAGFESRMSEDFTKQLNNLGIYVYVYTVNDIDIVNKFLQTGVYGFYTDSLEPNINMEMVQVQQRRDLESIDLLENYIEEISNCPNLLMIISVKDDAATGMQDRLQEIFYENGAKETLLYNLRASYVLVCANGEVFFEEKSSDKTVEYMGQIGESNLMVSSGGYECGNISNIIIDGIDYSPNQRGFNIVIYDLETNSVYDIINYDSFAGGVYTRYDSADMINKKNNLDFLLEYLSALVNENYLVLFSVNDDAGSYFSDEIQEKWSDLGLNRMIEYRTSYIGVIDGLECVYEESSKNNLIYDDFVDNLHIHVESSGFDAGCFSSIKVNGKEYSKNTRGLNIVVLDKRRNVVIDSISFDFYDKYSYNY